MSAAACSAPPHRETQMIRSPRRQRCMDIAAVHGASEVARELAVETFDVPGTQRVLLSGEGACFDTGASFGLGGMAGSVIF